MHDSKIEWVLNPDNKTLGKIWNPLTGCLNHTPEGLCLGGGFPCYAYKLAHGRLKSRYLAGGMFPVSLSLHERYPGCTLDPFYPRFWEDRLGDMLLHKHNKPKGIFVCDMSDLFGIGIPEEWTRRILRVIEARPLSRFYLLTKQPQNLIKFSPFPENCWVGVTATNMDMFRQAMKGLIDIQAKVKYISFEPLLEEVFVDPVSFKGFYEYANMPNTLIDWVIIGSQTKPKKLPEWEWVREIIWACDKANIPAFLKDNLGLPRLSADGSPPLYKRVASGTWELRQELPKEVG